MSQRLTKNELPILAACLVLIAVFLLLPLVSVRSYHWTAIDLAYKLPRLVQSAAERNTVVALLAGMILSPGWIVIRRVGGLYCSRFERLLPAAFALLLALLLLLGSRTASPDWGLWLYLAVALVVAAIHPRKQA